jgi:Ca2+/Na+ antiporter
LSLFSFITNFLEPLTCFFYVIVLGWQIRFSGNREVIPLLTYYFLASILLGLASLKIGKINKSNNWTYDTVIFLTAVLIGYFFYKIFQSSTKKKVVIILVSIYLVYAVIRNLTLEGIRLFDSIGYAIVSASLVIYVFMYFHQLLKNVTEIGILKEFNFWLAAGYLFYYAGSFIIFVSYHYLTKKILGTYTSEERDLLTALWGMHNVLLFISALSLLIGSLWISFRRKSG